MEPTGEYNDNNEEIKEKVCDKDDYTLNSSSYKYNHILKDNGTPTKTAEVYVPYNFTTSVSSVFVDVGDVVFQGTKITPHFTWSVDARANEYTSDTPYATHTPSWTIVRRVEFLASSSFDPSGNDRSTSDPCAYFGGEQCQTIDGEDITGMSVTDRARKGIGFAFQQPVRFKGIEVFDLIRLATGRKISSADACEYLSAVGLCARDYIKREVNSSLSGGELKRIEIATVLAKQPRLAVFDEPEAGIDLWSFNNLIEVFEGMRKNIKGSSILIISHQERILNIADEIVVIKEGTVGARGTKEEILPGLINSSAAVSYCNGVKGGSTNA